MARFIRIIAWLYLATGLLAALLVPASLFGWFGIAPDPLSAVFVTMLAMPWIMAANLFAALSTWAALALALAAIAFNFWLLRMLAKWFGT